MFMRVNACLHRLATISGLVPVLFTVALAIIWASPATAGEIPIWWNPHLNLASLQDIPEALNAPMSPKVTMTKAEAKVYRNASTCSQYLKLVGSGYESGSPREAHAEIPYAARCFALRDLQQVHPATLTYFSQQGWPASVLEQLPPLPDTEVGTELKEKLRALKEGERAWKQYDPQVALVRATSNTLVIEDQRATYTLTIVARGDFNGDGVEDIAVWVKTEVRGGTGLYNDYYIFTQTYTGGIWKLLTSEKPPYMLETH